MRQLREIDHLISHTYFKATNPILNCTFNTKIYNDQEIRALAAAVNARSHTLKSRKTRWHMLRSSTHNGWIVELGSCILTQNG